MKAKQIAEGIGGQLRLARKAKSWSLDKASHFTGVSKAMLGQIERGESSPTIAKLWDIANGFEYPLSYFLGAAMGGEIQTKPEQESFDKGLCISTVFSYDKATNIEVFSITLAPHHEHISQPHNAGVIEHIIVTSGVMEYLADGQWHQVQEGQCVKFDAMTRHGYRNRTEARATFQNIIAYTKGAK